MKSDGANTKVTTNTQRAINTNDEMFILALSVLSILNLVVEILPFAQDVKIWSQSSMWLLGCTGTESVLTLSAVLSQEHRLGKQ